MHFLLSYLILYISSFLHRIPLLSQLSPEHHFHLIKLPFMFFTCCLYIYSRGVDTAVSKDICKFCYIVLYFIKASGEKVAHTVRIHFFFTDSCIAAQIFSSFARRYCGFIGLPFDVINMLPLQICFSLYIFP